MALGFRHVHGDRAARAAIEGSMRPRIVGPIWEMPVWWVLLAGFLRSLVRLAVRLARHPILMGLALSSGYVLARYGRTTYLVSLASVCGVLAVWALVHRPSWLRFVGWPAYARWRRLWVYRRNWQPAMVTCGLAASFADHEYLPQIKRVRCTRYVDSVLVQLVSGQSPEQWEACTSQLAHTFGARDCKLRVAKPRHVWLHFTRADALAKPIPALPIVEPVNLLALPVGKLADLAVWVLRLLGTHLLIAGVTGAGKGSVVWSLIRALAPAIRDGLVALWVLDPKGGMELSAGRGMFARFECDTYDRMADLLDDAVSVMQGRAARLRGITRLHEPTPADPLIVIVVDELAALTAYCQDRELRRRMAQALSLLLSQGRAVGVLVVGALQDPRKDVLPFRDLFPTRIALRLSEAAQVDMVLGDGARDRGALCDRISPETPGVGYVVMDGVREPMRVRAAYVTDAEIDAMTAEFPSFHRPEPVDDEGWAA